MGGHNSSGTSAKFKRGEARQTNIGLSKKGSDQPGATSLSDDNNAMSQAAPKFMENSVAALNKNAVEKKGVYMPVAGGEPQPWTVKGLSDLTIAADPSGAVGKEQKWIVSQLVKGNIRLPEDGERVKNTIKDLGCL